LCERCSIHHLQTRKRGRRVGDTGDGWGGDCVARNTRRISGSSREELANAEIAGQIYELRTKAGLSQRQLAAKIGTTASVICRLEDADYTGHSLAMLRRIAAGLNKRVEIRFVSASRRRSVA
jgi:ribosome-binding protein aMBF1 (putative translation factor)